ncbi:hypothetical protein ONZ45_g11710 [Pleurotus djamor]|nr:hypothetical protein ONZ45_g11710 [Pleurotus djamor]
MTDIPARRTTQETALAAPLERHAVEPPKNALDFGFSGALEKITAAARGTDLLTIIARGATCSKDSTGRGRCSVGGDSGGGARTSTITTPTTTPISTVVVPRPTERPDSSAFVLSATDQQILYVGQWETTKSICNPRIQSRTTRSMYSSFSYRFVGSEIYLSITSFNAFYTVSIGGDLMTFGTRIDTVVPSNCTFSYGRTGLRANPATQSTLIKVSLHGPSSVTDERRWSFALEQILVVSDITANSSNVSTATSSASEGPARPTINGHFFDSAAVSKFDLEGSKVVRLETGDFGAAIELNI